MTVSDHVEKGLAGADDVQLVRDRGADMFLGTEPYDAAEVGVDHDDLFVRDETHKVAVHALGVLAA